jgi:hypothetical protein
MRYIPARLTYLYLAVALALGLLAGCASRLAETPAQMVFAVQTEYNGLLAIALAYESMPRCSETRPQPCSDPLIVEEIRKADNDAWAALLAAQEVVRSGQLQGSVFDASMVIAKGLIQTFTNVLANRGLISGGQ